jgi:hypothetical protein
MSDWLSGVGRVTVTFAWLVCLWAQAVEAGTPLELEGSLKGAPFRIVVPENWNGTLLVYARGTGSLRMLDDTGQPGKLGLTPLTNVPGVVRPLIGPDGPVIGPNGQPVLVPDNAPALELEQALLQKGYALASSDFGDAFLMESGLLGWVVEDGIRDTAALTVHFRKSVGEPHRTIFWSRSQGTLVSLASIETGRGTRLYDGVIAGCAVGAGASRSWDSAVDFALAYDVTFGWLADWGTVGDVRDTLTFAEVAPVLIQNLPNPANFGRFEFIRLVTGAPLAGYYGSSPVTNFNDPTFGWFAANMVFATEVRADVERKARGHVGQNVDHVYSLTDAEKGYLALLGVNADGLLAEMNARRNFTSSPQGRAYLRRFADFDGRIRRPVLTIHTSVDGLVLPSHERVYRDTVGAAGRDDLLVQVFTTAIGHCTFTSAQWLATVAAMDSWLETRVAPGVEFFPAALGFDHGFVPPPYPQPPAE